MPPDDRLRLDDHDPVKTAGPQTIEQNPEGPVQPRQPGAGSVTVSKNLQLVAKSHHLELQVDASPQAGKKAVNDGNDDLAHDTDATGHHLEKPGFLRRTEFMGGTGGMQPHFIAIFAQGYVGLWLLHGQNDVRTVRRFDRRAWQDAR